MSSNKSSEITKKRKNTKRKRDDTKIKPRMAPETRHLEGKVIMIIREWVISREKKNKENPECYYVLTSHIKNLPGYKDQYQALFKKHDGVQNFIRKYGGNTIFIGKNARNKPIIYTQ